MQLSIYIKYWKLSLATATLATSSLALTGQLFLEVCGTTSYFSALTLLLNAEMERGKTSRQRKVFSTQEMVVFYYFLPFSCSDCSLCTCSPLFYLTLAVGQLSLAVWVLMQFIKACSFGSGSHHLCHDTMKLKGSCCSWSPTNTGSSCWVCCFIFRVPDCWKTFLIYFAGTSSDYSKCYGYNSRWEKQMERKAFYAFPHVIVLCRCLFYLGGFFFSVHKNLNEFLSCLWATPRDSFFNLDPWINSWYFLV